MYFTGVTSYERAPGAHSYETARRVLEKASRTPTGRLREEKSQGYPLGRSDGVTWVREMQDKGYEGAIAFRLYATDVVIWHPDNSVEIDNFGSSTTSTFARRFLPHRMSLSHPTARRGASGGHKGINYCAERDDNKPGWQLEWRVCWGGLPRFREHNGVWLPDEDTLDEVSFPEISDRKGQREVAEQYHLRDFATWLEVAPAHMSLAHDDYDLDECAEALEKRDFRRAAQKLPLVKDTGAFGTDLKIIPIDTMMHDRVITMTSLTKLKLALWEAHGLLYDITFKTIEHGEFQRRMRRVSIMRELDIHRARDFGPPRW